MRPAICALLLIQALTTESCVASDGYRLGDGGVGALLATDRSRPLFASSDLTPEQIRDLE